MKSDIVKDRIVKSIETLGNKCTYKQAEFWLSENYGKDHGVKESTFYKIRQEFNKDKEVVEEKYEEEKAFEEVTFSELMKVKQIIKEIGKERFDFVLKCLDMLED